MSTEDVSDHIDRALELAVVGNVDLAEVEDELRDGLSRVEQLRTLRGGE